MIFNINRIKLVFAALLLSGPLMMAQNALPDSLLKAKMDSLHNVVRIAPVEVAPQGSISQPQIDIEEEKSNDIVEEVVSLTSAQLAARGDSLRLSYLFKEAVSEYQKAIAAADSLDKVSYEEKLVLAQNGLSMTGYCNQPVVVAKQKFSIEDFFLFYPLKDKSWRPVPNQLDSLDADDPIVKSMYVPDGSQSLYYSSMDEDHIHNIYVTHDLGDQWSVPELINEQLTSSSDEIFPMLSPDGRSLYFASKGLYGMGGYDLYVSKWNRENKDWDVPVNMGFPYSSPYDDFLFMNTEDGKYSIFASNRECSKDSVYIYVLEYDSMPVRKSISDVEALKHLAALSPAIDPSRIDNAAVSDKMPDNDDTKQYMDKMTEVRELRESIYQYGKALDDDRLRLASLEGVEKADLMNDILQREMSLPAMNDSLSRAVKQLQQIEMDFLLKGVVIDIEKIQAEADREVVGAASGYTFTKKSMGGPLNLDIMVPKEEFDYTFMVLPEGRFAEDNTLPSGIVYQIQMFTTATKATVKDLKGLSPVFEKLHTSLKYTYSVGVFRTYKDVLANLNKVKRAGFRDAIIVAFNNGKAISVADARSQENQITTLYTVKIYPGDSTLPDLTKTAIKQHTDKDIIRTLEDGAVVFLAGPFDDQSKAESLATAVKATGVSNVKIESSLSK